jgi:putative resolvase
VKLSEWAVKNGLSYRTAHRWFRQGILPAKAIQLPTGTILVSAPEGVPVKDVALYARVSSHDQKADLERQKGRLVTFATKEGHKVGKVVEEVGSGLDGHRTKLLAVLRGPNIGAVVVEHRDRLTPFGAEYIEASLAASGRKLIVMEEGEVEDDLVRDMTEVLTSFCARLYGKRSARNRAKRALDAAKEAV